MYPSSHPFNSQSLLLFWPPRQHNIPLCLGNPSYLVWQSPTKYCFYNAQVILYKIKVDHHTLFIPTQNFFVFRYLSFSIGYPHKCRTNTPLSPIEYQMLFFCSLKAIDSPFTLPDKYTDILLNSNRTVYQANQQIFCTLITLLENKVKPLKSFLHILKQLK